MVLTRIVASLVCVCVCMCVFWVCMCARIEREFMDTVCVQTVSVLLCVHMMACVHILKCTCVCGGL